MDDENNKNRQTAGIVATLGLVSLLFLWNYPSDYDFCEKEYVLNRWFPATMATFCEDDSDDSSSSETYTQPAPLPSTPKEIKPSGGFFSGLFSSGMESTEETYKSDDSSLTKTYIRTSPQPSTPKESQPSGGFFSDMFSSGMESTEEAYKSKAKEESSEEDSKQFESPYPDEQITSVQITGEETVTKTLEEYQRAKREDTDIEVYQDKDLCERVFKKLKKNKKPTDSATSEQEHDKKPKR